MDGVVKIHNSKQKCMRGQGLCSGHDMCCMFRDWEGTDLRILVSRPKATQRNGMAWKDMLWRGDGRWANYPCVEWPASFGSLSLGALPVLFLRLWSLAFCCGAGLGLFHGRHPTYSSPPASTSRPLNSPTAHGMPSPHRPAFLHLSSHTLRR